MKWHSSAYQPVAIILMRYLWRKYIRPLDVTRPAHIDVVIYCVIYASKTNIELHVYVYSK